MQTPLNAQHNTKDWDVLPELGTVEIVLSALKSRGFMAELVPDRGAALEKLGSLIPDGAQVMTGGSTTLNEIGFTELLASGNHRWVNLKGPILAEKDRDKQFALRRQAQFADYFVGGIQAITMDGQMVAGSATGSQLAAYSFGGRNLIIVAGTQKITANLDQALQRVREYCTPLEDKRMKGIGAPGSILSKVFIYEKERIRNVNVILVNERLGF
jgi:hypothetical protein